MELKEAIKKYRGLTIYTSFDKYFEDGYRQKEFFERLGIFNDDMKPAALYLTELAEDKVYLLYEYPKKRKEKLNKLKTTQII
jgi:hypothetical protein